jgi:hypothetical protein
MPRFRLKSATMVLHCAGQQGRASVIPAGAEVIASGPDLRSTGSPNRLIQVQWGGEAVTLYQVDLLERGERIDEMKNP